MLPPVYCKKRIIAAVFATLGVISVMAGAGCGSANGKASDPESEQTSTSGGTGSLPAGQNPSTAEGAPPSGSDQPARLVETGTPRDSAKVYWVGHSLMSHEDNQRQGARSLLDLLGDLVPATGQSYAMFQHTIPGAPLFWNWGINDRAWEEGVRDKIPPLVDPDHADYGSFDVMVVTEGIPVTLGYGFMNSGFYARRFFCAALRANPNVELFVYESWPHFQAGDPEYAPVYGPRESFDFVAFLRGEHSIWEDIIDDASDPSRKPGVPDDYRWSGDGEDPGQCDGILPVHIVPTGAGLVALIERLRERRTGDDWSYAAAVRDGTFGELDLFQNPLTNYPADLSTTVFGGDIDDIHASQALAYFNTLVHYATIYRRDPAALAAANGVPDNVANIMKEVAWSTVTGDARTGVAK